MRRVICCTVILFFCLLLQAQDSTQRVSSKYLDAVKSKASDLSEKLDKKSEKALTQLQKQEDRIKRKLARLDSSKAIEVFGDAESKYTELKQKLENPSSLTQYIPYLDTLKTSLKFLEDNKGLLG